MSVYRRLAVNSIENTWKRGGVPKPFGQDCSSGRLGRFVSKFPTPTSRGAREAARSCLTNRWDWSSSHARGKPDRKSARLGCWIAGICEISATFTDLRLSTDVEGERSVQGSKKQKPQSRSWYPRYNVWLSWGWTPTLSSRQIAIAAQVR